MSEQSLSQTTMRNSAWNVAAFFMSIIFSIVVTPFVLHRLGFSAYGLIILVNTIVSILALLELGMGASLIKMIAEAVGSDATDAIEERMGSVLLLTIIIGILGVVIFLFLAWFGADIFKVPAANNVSIRMLFYIGAGTFFLNTISVPFASVLPALQRYDILSKISVLNGMFLNCATVLVVWLGFHEVAVMSLQFISTIILSSIYFRYSRKLLPHVRIRIHSEFKSLSPVANFGFFIFLKNIATQALAHFDKVIVTSVLGPAAVSFYSIPGSISIKTIGITQSISDTLFPLASSLSAEKGMDTIRLIYPRVIRNIILLAAGCSMAIIIFGKKILLLWLGPTFVAQSTHALYFLTVTYFILSVYSAVSSLLFGLGIIKLPAVAALVMFGLNMLFLFILLPKFHITGAALAYFLSVLVAPVIILIFEFRYLKRDGVVKFYATLFAKHAATTAVYYGICRFVLLPAIYNVPRLIIIGPIAVLLYYGLFKIFGFMEDEDWIVFKNFFLSVLKKLKIS